MRIDVYYQESEKPLYDHETKGVSETSKTLWICRKITARITFKDVQSSYEGNDSSSDSCKRNEKGN